ncbi:unnamed protein product [Fraxinus pennsylvanica]|uniref:Uncharacterized protein n=1 Tax=Fraxinus pennsylvanica TaxID=56036 RepID=A0AAD2A4C7_9LAMI|nr:unnamed protein product [Fraxinus pennsylvanica]
MSSTDDTSQPSDGAKAAAIVLSLVIFLVIGVISCYCAKKMRKAIVSELRAAVVPPAQPPLNVIQVWEVDAPTMERFLRDLAQEKPVRFTAQQLCSFTIGRRKNTIVGSTDSLDWFPKKVWEEYEKGELTALTEAYGIEEKDRAMAEKMSMVALWCVQDSPEARPPMSAVVKMLEGGVEIKPPPKPFHYLFSVGVHVLPNNSGSDSTYSTSGTNSYWYKETTPIMKKYEIQMASA